MVEDTKRMLIQKVKEIKKMSWSRGQKVWIVLLIIWFFALIIWGISLILLGSKLL